MQKPKNICELRDRLLEAFSNAAQDPDQLARHVKVAGAVISSIKCELVYAGLRRERVDIPFMHYEGREAIAENVTDKGYDLLREIHKEIDPEPAQTV